jgi:hypothetical protein
MATMSRDLSFDAILNTATSGNDWSAIQQTPEYLDKLRQLVHNENILVENGYVVAPLTKEEIELKKRCKNCRREFFRHLRFQME